MGIRKIDIKLGYIENKRMLGWGIINIIKVNIK